LLGSETENVEDRTGGRVKERTQNGGGNHLENVHYGVGEGDGRSALMWTVEE
jgi:hypothetical protein